jgi:predicted lysophospholipase L1 biosynthesis ABC-type transport system permease subunit
MARCGITLAAGRMPTEGQPEAVLSEDIARNLGLKIGAVLSDPQSQDRYAPVPVRLVGLLRGPVWLGLTSRSFVDAYSPFTWTGYLAFARTTRLADQRRLDSEIDHVITRGKVRVWKFEGLVRETKQALANLYLILNIIIVLVSTLIAGTVGLLINIYFVQRLPEFATLAAIGYSRGELLRRALGETILLCVLGWLLGGLLTTGILWVMKVIVLTPRGLLLNPVDIGAYGYTLPLPVAVWLFAVATISIRMSRLDPVSIIEHRG